MPEIKIKCSICDKEIKRTSSRQKTCLSESCRQIHDKLSKRDHKRAKRAGIWKRIVFDEKDWREKRRNDPEVIWEAYRRRAKSRGLIFEISLKEFMKWWKLSCFYCGDAIRTIGLDRIDNDKGYSKENLAPCCSTCNRMKMTMRKQDFISQCKKIAKTHG